MKTQFRCIAFAVLAAVMAQAHATNVVVLSDAADTMVSVHPNNGGGSIPQGGLTFASVIGLSGYTTSPLLKFDTSSLAGDLVNGDGVVSLRYLNVNYANSVAFNVSVVNSNWSESTVTWNNFGFTVGNPIATQTALIGQAEGSLVQFTIPKAVLQGWIDSPGSNNGLLLAAVDSQQRDFSFATKEYIPTGGLVGSWAPTLTLSVSAVPESDSKDLAVVGVLALAAVAYRRKSEQ